MTPPELLTEWARLLLGSLRAAGLRDVLISPGSRSTPFAWAALQDRGLECRSITDERSAAFFALGHARMTGRPVLLICTSGTAAAHYFPAVIEAAEAAVPLLVLTADRPLELQHAAAAQTIDQVKMYGDHVRAYFELGTPDPDPRMIRALPRLAAQALFATLHPVPGPVHVNARARKPLEPMGGRASVAIPELDALIEAIRPTPTPTAGPDPAAIATLAGQIAEAQRGLLVCGPTLPGDAVDLATVRDLVRVTGFPVAAEPASQLRFADGRRPHAEVDALATLLEVDGFADAHRPDLVVQVGRPPTASAWLAALDRWDTEHWVLAAHGWPASTGKAQVLHGSLDRTVRALLAAAETKAATAPRVRGDPGWSDSLRTANDLAWRVTEDALEDGFSEGAAVREVVDRLPRRSVLVLGNSLPIREVERFVPAADRGLEVLSQRGANGIDGLVSGAAGAAATGRPTTLLLGDVSFLHDIGGLAVARDLPAPLTVVVLNNGGGRIFERLPVAGWLEGDAALGTWLTPPDLDIEAACRAFDVRFARATDRASLRTALGDARSGSTVVEVVVPADGTTAHQRRLRDRLAEELAG